MNNFLIIKSCNSRLTMVGRQVLSLNRICLCSDSLSKMWSRGPLLSEHRRQRSVNAVKLRSSGSVIAKHLMRRSRRHELSMYEAVRVGWRETGARRLSVRPAGHGRVEAEGWRPPLRPGGTGVLPPGGAVRRRATLLPTTPRPLSHRPADPWSRSLGKCASFLIWTILRLSQRCGWRPYFF